MKTVLRRGNEITVVVCCGKIVRQNVEFPEQLVGKRINKINSQRIKSF